MSQRPILKSAKLANVLYDVRGPIVDAAKQMEDEGQKIIKLNIGNLAPFGFEAPDGATTEVRVPASQYWPRNALKPGQTLCLLAPALAHFGGQSILGLPLFAGRYAVFDRDRAGGAGVVRLASSHG